MSHIINNNLNQSVTIPADTQVQKKEKGVEPLIHQQAQRVTDFIRQAASRVENATWYIDWTSWNYPIPEGVDTVNIFVGEITLINGKPTMNGFGNFTADKLRLFVDSCRQKGISVKVSIGGGGGSYTRCWDRLTESNVQSFAQGMADFCHLHRIDGVDFDYEEFASSAQEKLVGELIKNFKAIDPRFQTSLCCNAGFSTWQPIVKTILDAAKDSTGHCALDRLYIMSYYNPLAEEEGWVTDWFNWLKKDYQFSPSQVTVGLDNFDAHAYDIAAFATWAKNKGFSSSYWAWNPASPHTSNVTSMEIWKIYHSSYPQISTETNSKKLEATVITGNGSVSDSHSHRISPRRPLAAISS